MGLGFGSGEGSSPADPPFAQLGGETSGGWKDRMSSFGAGAFNALAPSEMKSAVAGVGEMRAYQKRRDAKKAEQHKTAEDAEHEDIMQQVKNNMSAFGIGGNR